MPAPLNAAFALNAITVISTEDDILTADFTRRLRTGELLATSPAPTLDVLEGGNGMTFGAPTVNTSTVTDDFGNTIAAQKCVQFERSGGSPDPAQQPLLCVIRVTATLTTGKKRAGLCRIYLQG